MFAVNTLDLSACCLLCNVSCVLHAHLPILIPTACLLSSMTSHSSIHTIMETNCNNNNNTNVLSSKKGPAKRACCGSRPGSGPDLLRDVERLRAALSVERGRNQQTHRRFSLELRKQREEARQERERALRELTYRLEQQKALELLRQRDRLGRERAAEVRRLLRWRGQEKQKRTRELQRQLANEFTGTCGSGVSAREFGCKGNGPAYRKLEESLKTLFTQVDGQQIALLQRLQQEVEIEKSYFLCHLLEAHIRPVREDEHDRTGCNINPTRQRSKSCVHLLSGVQGHPESSLFRSHSLSKTPPRASPRLMKKDSETPPLCSSTTEEESCEADVSGDKPQPSDEEKDLQPSGCAEENMDMVRL